MTREAPHKQFTYDDARRFYNRFGSLQDSQRFYEDPAVRALCSRAEFRNAKAVLEFGCGTGRLAQQLLAHELAPEATYLGFDISRTMVDLASERTRPFGECAEIRLIDGAPRLNVADASCDRFVSVYVLDLLSTEDSRLLLAEAYRVLAPGGKLAIANLTRGRAGFSRMVTWGWEHLYKIHPFMVGGCHPIDVRALLNTEHWDIEYHDAVAPFAIAQEILVASRR